MMLEGLVQAAEILADSGRVVVSTGAGMSRESGIPTFRDAREGLWSRFSPQELATEQGFRADPRRVWSWYAARRGQITACIPHPGYHALVELADRVGELTIVTQNIDNLHREAGSGDVIELHGNIHRFKCLDRHHMAETEIPVPGHDEPEADPPPCPRCGSPLRPDVVWFGEMLPTAATERAWDLARRCNAMLVVGTSGTVWPAAELPLAARDAGAAVIEVGPEPSEITPVTDLFLKGQAGTVLPALVRAVREHLLADDR